MIDRNVKEIISMLKKEKPEMSKDERMALAISIMKKMKGEKETVIDGVMRKMKG